MFHALFAVPFRSFHTECKRIGCLEGEVCLCQEFTLDASVIYAAHQSVSQHLCKAVPVVAVES